MIAAGDSGELCWSTEETRDAFLQVLGPDIHSTFYGDNLLGNCAWVFGTEDNRWGIYSLSHPAAGKTAGGVKLTLDRRLQEYAAQLVRQNGHEEAYIIVSDYKTGEILGRLWRCVW